MTFAQKNKKIINRILSVIIPISRLRHRIRHMLFSDYGFWGSFYRNMWLKNCEKRFNKQDLNVPFLSIVAIIKNEGPYLQEWIEYHRIVGVEKFFIYDNESSDNTREILQPYIDSGVVEYTYYPGVAKQCSAYNDCLVRHHMDTHWLAIIDLDEFIVPIKFDSITEILKNIPAEYTQIQIDWQIFGSNGHIEKPDGLVIENYTKRASQGWLYKSIINPRMCISADVHTHDCFGKILKLSTNDIQINHYYCKSWAEYQRRKNRGDATMETISANRYNHEQFNFHDKNDIVDELVLRYLSELKQKMSKHSGPVIQD